MKNNPENGTKVTKKSTTSKATALNDINRKSLSEVKGKILSLIMWQYSSNAYISKLAGLFGNTAQENYVSISCALAECYGMPDKADEVSEILSRNEPQGFHNSQLTFAAEVAEAEIFSLHLQTVPNDKSCEIYFTDNALTDILINSSIVDGITSSIDNMRFYSEEKPFNFSWSNKNCFGIDVPFTFMYQMLDLSTEALETRDSKTDMVEECHAYIINAVALLREVPTHRKPSEAKRMAENIRRVIVALKSAYKI